MPSHKKKIEKTEAAQPDWKSSIKDIAKSAQSKTEKADAVELLAKKFNPSADQLKQFQTHIIEDFQSRKYLKDANNSEYMLSNLFQSVVVEHQADESQAMKKYAYDFYQNTKYVYRGAETATSDSVKSNEKQMTKALNGN